MFNLIRSYEGKELALEYEKYRPKYTREMAEKIMKQVYLYRPPDSHNKLGKMLDVGCGGGQSTRLFSPFFYHNLGIDISMGQIEIAKEITNDKNIEYQAVSDCKFPVEDNSIDFVLCGASLHWMNFAEFELECERVLKPNGVVAAFQYFLTQVVDIKSGRNILCGDEYTKVFSDYLKAINAHPRNRMFLERYRPVFQQLSSKNKRWVKGTTLSSMTTLFDLRGYFSTVGEYPVMMKTNPKIDPLDVVMENLKEIWNLEKEKEKEKFINLQTTFDLDLIMFNK